MAQGYEDPEKFDPDRFGPERQEDIKFAPNFLVFGHGPHYCVGKDYAQVGKDYAQVGSGFAEATPPYYLIDLLAKYGKQ